MRSPCDVLVTGGSGFIGSHVVDALTAAGRAPRIFDARPSRHHPDVPAVVADLGDLGRLRAAMEGCTAVIHLAASADVNEVEADPLDAERRNAGGTAHVLEAARRAGVDRVVYASTIWAYSDTPAELHEEGLPLHAPAHLYTATKLAGEHYCRAYAELYGLHYTILRFGIPYGPRARPAAVLPAFVNRALAGEPLTIAGDGSQSRRFVHVEDLADGVVRALAPVAANRTYNLVGAEDVTIREIAERVRAEIGDVEIRYAPGRSADFAGAPVCGRRAAEELGWQAATPFAEGVRRYVAWHLAEVAAPAPVPPRPALRTFARRAALGLGWAVAIAVMILGVVSLAPVGQANSHYGMFFDALLLMLPLVLAGGFGWDAPAAGALQAALWIGAVVCLVAGVAPWPSLIDRISDGHQAVLVLLAVSSATGARLVGSRPALSWLAAPGE